MYLAFLLETWLCLIVVEMKEITRIMGKACEL